MKVLVVFLLPSVSLISWSLKDVDICRPGAEVEHKSVHNFLADFPVILSVIYYLIVIPVPSVLPEF